MRHWKAWFSLISFHTHMTVSFAFDERSIDPGYPVRNTGERCGKMPQSNTLIIGQSQRACCAKSSVPAISRKMLPTIRAFALQLLIAELPFVLWSETLCGDI